MDLSKLTPAPHGREWVVEQQFQGAGQWIVFECWDGNRNPKIGHFHEKADAEFYALARNAFDVMMRRGWCLRSEWSDHGTFIVNGWSVVGCRDDGIHKHLVTYPDPFTALIEADAWYKANIEARGG